MQIKFGAILCKLLKGTTGTKLPTLKPGGYKPKNRHEQGYEFHEAMASMRAARRA